MKITNKPNISAYGACSLYVCGSLDAKQLFLFFKCREHYANATVFSRFKIIGQRNPHETLLFSNFSSYLKNNNNL